MATRSAGFGGHQGDPAYRQRVNGILRGLKDGSFVLTPETRAELKLLLLDAAWARFVGADLQNFYSNPHLYALAGKKGPLALEDGGRKAMSSPSVPSVAAEYAARVERPTKPVWVQHAQRIREDELKKKR